MPKNSEIALYPLVFRKFTVLELVFVFSGFLGTFFQLCKEIYCFTGHYIVFQLLKIVFLIFRSSSFVVLLLVMSMLFVGACGWFRSVDELGPRDPGGCVLVKGAQADHVVLRVQHPGASGHHVTVGPGKTERSGCFMLKEQTVQDHTDPTPVSVFVCIK